MMILPKKMQYFILLVSLLLSFGNKTLAQTTIFLEDFEGASASTYTTPQSSISGLTGWSFDRTNYGRLRMAAGSSYYHGGSRAATLDATSTSVTSVNYLIKEYDLFYYNKSKNLELSFYFMDHGDETDVNYDEVWVRGKNTNSWIKIYSLDPVNKTNGSWNFVNKIDIDSILKANNQQPDKTFQLRFGQADNGSSTSTTGAEGITFDDIKLTGTPYYGLDIATISIDSPVSWKSGNNKLVISCKNMGLDTIKYFGIGYKLDAGSAVQVDSINCSNLLSSQTFKYTFSNSLNVSTGNHNLSIWVKKPNGVTSDSNTKNDTLKISFWTSLKDTFYIDTSGNGHFKTFNDAVSTLKNAGVAGPVVFMVRNGTYTERIVIPEIPNASSTNTITFKGIDKAKAIISFAGTSSINSAAIVLNGADYIIFDNLTVINTGASYGIGFFFTSNANRNKISNCKIQCNSSSSSSLCCILASGVESSMSNYANNGFYNIIENNLIMGGYYGIRWNGLNYDSIYHLTIKGNNFIEQYYYSIYQYYCSGSKIISNIIEDPFYSSHIGIYSQYCSLDTIVGNKIQSGYYGIYLNYNNYYHTSRNSLIANNMISNLLSTSSQVGIYLYRSYRNSVIHNTVWLNGTTSSYSSACVYLYYSNNNLIKNNILISTGSNYLISIYNSNSIALDYNNYYYTSASMYRYYLGSSYNSYSSFLANTTYTGVHDGNSKDNVNPYLISTTDLHFDPSKTRNLTGVTTSLKYDFDGDLRCTASPSMGADELPHSKVIFYSDTLINFDSVQQTFTKNINLTIQNVSCSDTIIFYKITSSDTTFKPNASSFTLNPGQSKVVTVGFKPLNKTTYSSNLVIYNSYDTNTIKLKGIGIGIARFDIDPDTINVSLTGCNDSLTVKVVVKNTGNEVGYLQIPSNSYGSTSGNKLKVLTCTYGTDLTREYPNTLAAINTFFSNYTLTATATTVADTLAKYLAINDVVIFPEMESGTTTHFSSFGPKLIDFAKKGGRIIFCGSSSTYTAGLNLTGLIGTVAYATNVTSVISYDTNNPIMKWAPASFTGPSATTSITSSDTGFKKYAGISTSTVIGYKKIGYGDFVYLGFDYYNYSNTEARIISNAVKSERVSTTWINFSGYNKSLAANAKDSFYIKVRSTGLKSGVHKAAMKINSNDPFRQNDSIRIIFTVKGIPVINSYTKSLNFDSIPQNTNKSISFYIGNTGCDTLFLSGYSNYTGAFKVSSGATDLLPGDSTKYTVTFSSSNIGTYTDTLIVFNNSKAFKLFLIGKTYATPIFHLKKDTISVSIKKCNDSLIVPVKVYNTGKVPLTYEILSKSTSVGTNLKDNFDPSPNSNLWYSYTGSAANSCGSYSGTNALYFNTSGTREAITKDLNTLYMNTLSFYLKFGSGSSPCEKADAGENVSLQYSNNSGSTWTSIATYYTGSYSSFTKITATLPSAAKTNKTRFRWYQLKHSGSGFDNWSIDDVEIQTAGTGFISSNNQKDTVVVGDSSTFYFKVNTIGLSTGVYNSYLLFKSNDPQKSSDTIFVKLDYKGTSTIVLSDTSIDYGKIIVGSFKYDSLIVKNTGCADLNLTNIYATNSSYSVSPSSAVIKPQQSASIYIDFYPTYGGSMNAKLVILNNAKDTFVWLKGYGSALQQIDITTTSIYDTISVCNDSVYFPLKVYNKGDFDLNIAVYDSGMTNSKITGISDDFDPTIETAFWSAVSGSVSSVCGANSGNYTLYFNNSGTRQAATVDINTTSQTNISFALKIATGSAPCDDVEVGEEIFLQYSNDGGGTWYSIKSYSTSYYSTFTPVSETIPAAARTLKTRFRWHQKNHSGLGQDNWMIDDVKIGTISSNPVNWLSFDPETAIVPGQDSSIVKVWLKSKGYKSGLYKGFVVIASNDKTKPNQVIPINLRILSSPLIAVQDSAINFDTTSQFTTQTKIFRIYNKGCEILNITDVKTFTSQFTVSQNSFSIGPMSYFDLKVTFKPTFQSSFSDSIYIKSNDKNLFIKLSGVGSLGPVLSISKTYFHKYLSPCFTLATSELKLENKGNKALMYSIPPSSLPSWLTLTNYGGTIYPGNTMSINLLFNVKNLASGNYNSKINIISNDSSAIGSNFVCEVDIVSIVKGNMDLGPDTFFCSNSYIELDAGAGFTDYLWSNNLNTRKIKITKPGVYSVLVIDDKSCMFGDTITVSSRPAPEAAFSVKDSVQCFIGNNFEFTDQSSISSGKISTWSWSFGDGANTTGKLNINHQYSTFGYYNVTLIVNAENQCTDTNSVKVHVLENPVVTLGADKNITTKDSTVLDAGSGFSKYLWNTKATTQSIVIKGSVVGEGKHLYYVTVENSTVCTGRDSVFVNIIKYISIKDVEGKIIAKIYPNPANEYVIVETVDMPDCRFTISLMNAEGKVLAEKEVLPEKGMNKHVLNVEGFAKGMYLIRISSADFIYTDRVFVY